MPITRSKRRLEEVSEDQEPDYTNKKTNILIESESSESSESESESISLGNIDTESSESDTESSEETDCDAHDIMLEKIKCVDNVAYENMKDVLEIINSKNPEIMNILKLPMRSKDRAKIVEFYEIFKNTHPSTEDWLELRFRLNLMIKKYTENYKEYSKYSSDELADIKSESQKIKSQITPDFALKYKILRLNTSESNKAAIYKKYQSYKNAHFNDDERVKLKTWIDFALSLPYNNSIDMLSESKSTYTIFLTNIIKSLNMELYGMKYVKEQLLLFLNSKLTNPNMKGCSLALVGPPGVGKTTIARHLAEVMKWPFEQISFGGAGSADFLKGHDYTYVGSRPGEIVRCLSRMKYKNGILFLDEYEKVSENKDIASSLLHITDFQQNHEFQDNYLSDIKIDLSQLWFIYSMNELPKDTALRDRLFVINVPAYSKHDKATILKDYVLPKTLRNINLRNNDVYIDDKSSQYIVNCISSEESGIRSIEQNIKDIVNKINFIVINQDNDGNIPKEFNFMSFDTKDMSKLSYPVELTIDLFDILFKSIKTKSTLPFGMYM